MQEATPPPTKNYASLSVKEFLDRPRKPWTIPGLLPASGLAVIYGAPNVGKSFITVDLIHAIAEGGIWLEKKKCKQRGVVLVALEGADAMGDRIRAWSKNAGRPSPDKLRLLWGEDGRPPEFLLDNDQDVESLANWVESAQLGEAPVIVIDTLSAAMLGLDENSTADAGAALRRLRRLVRMTGGLVIVVGHTGKDLTKGVRGSNKLQGDSDAMFQVRANGKSRSLRVDKMRDAPKGSEWSFELVDVVCGEDEDGQEVTSCAVRHGERKDRRDTADAGKSSRADRAEPELGKHQLLMLDVIKTALAAGEAKSGVPAESLTSPFKARFDGRKSDAGSLAKKILISLAVRGIILLAEDGTVKMLSGT